MQTRHQTNHILLTAVSIGSLVLAATPNTAQGQVVGENTKLLANDGTAGDFFGWSIAIKNGIVAVGSNQDDPNGLNSGSAYVFDSSSGSQLFKLVPSDGAAGDNFGRSIAIDNNIIAVGAYSDNDRGASSGSAYLYDLSTGDLLFKLFSRDHWSRDYFGTSIAIDNGIVAVGADGKYENVGPDFGAAYLFDVQTGTQITKLLRNDGAVGDYFGRSIDIENNTVVVGSFLDDDNGTGSGSAYLFDTAGTLLFKLLPTDGLRQDRFGRSVALSDGIVAVGAYLADTRGTNSGAVYLFDATTGEQTLKIVPDDLAANDWFGWSVAIDKGIVAVGVISGGSYLFDASTGTQIARFVRSDSTTGDQFGRSVAVDNNLIAIGALMDDDNGDQSGSAYIFDTSCLADLDHDGNLNRFDISAFLTLYNNQDPIVDFTNDGIFNFSDVSAYLALFAAGCP